MYQDSANVFLNSAVNLLFSQAFYQRSIISTRPISIIGHSIFIHYFYQVNNRWLIGTGAHFEFVNISDFGSFTNSGISLDTQLNMGKRFYLQLNNKVSIDRNSISTQKNVNYNIGLKLGYQLF